MSAEQALLSEVKNVLRDADCLLDMQQIDARVLELGDLISMEIANKNPVVLCMMNGGLPYTAALLRCFEFPLQLDYLHYTRYQGALSGGEMDCRVSASLSLSGRVVLLVDDVLDQGVSLQIAKKYCQQQGVDRVYTTVLVSKQLVAGSQVEQADFVGFECEDRYLFGFGMDYKNYLRNAPGIFAVKND